MRCSKKTMFKLKTKKIPTKLKKYIILVGNWLAERKKKYKNYLLNL